MSAAKSLFVNQLSDLTAGWQQFWFRPAEAHTLALIRVLAGGMLFYTHLVWGIELTSFLGAEGWLPNQLARSMNGGGYAWSYLWYVSSPTLLWVLHIGALLVFAMLTAGLFTRVVAVLAWLITISYCHRLSGAFFGLDQVNAMLAMYLMLGPCGDHYSLDRWRRSRAGQGAPAPTVSANIATRLIQLHLCVIYLFGGIAKMRGQMWWDGSAFWYSIANAEYQSIEMTWLVHYPKMMALFTHLTIFWETFYGVLVWPRRLRPFMLAMAIAVHGGIACFLGMITFGVAMLFANLAFVSPQAVRRVLGPKTASSVETKDAARLVSMTNDE